MSTEFNELLQYPYGDGLQIWIVGSREQVLHTVNEFYSCLQRRSSAPG